MSVQLFKDARAGLPNGGAVRKPQEHNFSSMDEDEEDDEDDEEDDEDDDDDELPSKKITSTARPVSILALGRKFYYYYYYCIYFTHPRYRT